MRRRGGNRPPRQSILETSPAPVMHTRDLLAHFRLVRGLLWGAVLALTLAAPAAAQSQLSIVAPEGQVVDTLLERGAGLEAGRRWGEALTLYEEALRDYPGDARLEERFHNSRIRYDLARRYSDSSFNQSLGALSEADALNLYHEVLLKVQSHYVDQPEWAALVAAGTECLDLALEDELFVARNLARRSPEQIAHWRSELHQHLSRLRISNRNEARDAVRLAAGLAQQRLGLASTAVVMEYVCGATNSLDDYSTYLTGAQLNEVYSQIDGNFVGLGIELKAADGALAIVKVIPGSPAEQGGILAGDRIVAVDGRTTSELNTDQAADLLQGPEGSLVEVSVITPGRSPRRLRLKRRQVDVPSVDDVRMLDTDQGIGYLKLICFQKTTTRDLDAALWRLHRQGMRSLVMDLRGNPGGLLTSSVEVADKFVDEGTIVSTRGRNPHEDYSYSAHRAGTWRVPLVVLIDGDSASASEIFAGAIRDHRRGTIVGTRSYGKGSVQGIFPLNFAGAGIRLTTAKFYSPLGRPYSRVGVDPDVLVQETLKPVATAATPDLSVDQLTTSDPVLDRALQVARGHVARR